MTNRLKLVPRLAMFVLLAGLSAGGAWADKPDWAGQGKPSKGDKERHEGRQPEGRQGAEMRHGFNDDSRRFVNDYYGSQFRKGKCPPGLAKKHNGCMPPGQARKWHVGRPLPRDVVYYLVPQPLVVQIGMPPSGYRYVRVASDILMIAIGTGMVVDAIQDLGR